MSRFRNPTAPPFPPTLHAEIRRAHTRALELASEDREIHFATDPAGRVVVELRTLDGRLLERISAALALALINGCDPEAALEIMRSGSEAPPTPPPPA